MLTQASGQSSDQSETAHVIVLGNEKGGSGKSTTAMHVAVGLMNLGQRVATIDLDSRQQSLTHQVQNRRAWAQRTGADLTLPRHHRVALGSSIRVDENEQVEFSGFAEAVASVERSHDFIVVDTPGTDSYLTRLAHSMADTLITPLNDSYVDFDVLASVDPATFAVTGESHYTEMVREARKQRRMVVGADFDWIVVRNRLSMLGSRNKQRIGANLAELSKRLGFRCIDGFAERVVYREFFPRGLTALDKLDEATLGTRPSMSHLTAQQEIMGLIAALDLPIDERGVRRAAAKVQWEENASRAIEADDLVT